jgi:hypothetical protein
MPKKTAMIVLVIGLAIIIAALVDVFGMSDGFNLDLGDVASFSEWPAERLILLAAGVLVAVWGAYSLSQKRRKKK